MIDTRVVLVTGVAGFWGSRVAAQLLERADLQVMGLDVEVPDDGIEGLDFVQADVRNPLLADLFETANVDTVCHLAFVETSQPDPAAYDANVKGTMHLLEACAEAGVRKVVLKSSMAVYGAHADNPAFLTEARPLRGSRRYGYVRDLIDVEKFCAGFAHHAPALLITILRFSSIAGPRVDTPMTRFLREPWTPSLLGFDPMIQVIHEDDVVRALVHALDHDVPGLFNVAAEGVMPLNRLRSLAGKRGVAVAHPLAYWAARALGAAGLGLQRYAPVELDYIRYPWVGDLRRMREELSFRPLLDAEEALRDFAARHRGGPYPSEPVWLSCDEERLRGIIDVRRQARAEQGGPSSAAEEGDDE
jgi:UDP-glucose 4-epimerase